MCVVNLIGILNICLLIKISIFLHKTIINKYVYKQKKNEHNLSYVVKLNYFGCIEFMIYIIMRVK